MRGSNKTFKMKQLTTYLNVKLDLLKPKERKLPPNTDQGGFWSGPLSGPGESSEWSLVSFAGLNYNVSNVNITLI